MRVEGKQGWQAGQRASRAGRVAVVVLVLLGSMAACRSSGSADDPADGHGYTAPADGAGAPVPEAPAGTPSAGDAAAPGSGGSEGSAGTGTTAAPHDPAALYAQCRQRVEEPEADGECVTDGDCAVGGCSGEVCAPARALEGRMGSCEVLPCFSVLDRCGCVEGRCSWTIKANTRVGPRIALPPPDGG
ncbi:MAG: hypothetical protein D6798_19730 [Deltaproteobacteria bacterium]|nr:MAG: hypothetical protein D6798_19730 [Deltaproteobacteria bacterium]